MKETATVRCQVCKATRVVPMEKYVIGDVLQPFPGGGDYGKCLRCGRTGLLVVEVPQLQPIKAVGWHKMPEA